ncbi:MAG: TraG/TraD/VirD4 family protein [Anaerolineaceae bacterium]|nr:TraG/TraD/VirD4 family protein [Anaerolineaceae bacterium]
MAIEKRNPYYLYIDEFQDFACNPGAAETFSQMLSQVRKFGLHLILANQSIAQLSEGLQTALGNAQTIISFRISRADAEVLARVLGNVNPGTIKQDSQTDIQHPMYSPINEQWEDFIQRLTSQQVRQFTVKTADDRIAVIWSENLSRINCSKTRLEDTLIQILSQYGVPFENVHTQLVKPVNIIPSNPIFAY